MSVIVNYGIVLVVMAVLSLIFGVAAGNTCATASTGFARNLRQDMFYHIQDYSFENIDKFSVSSLVTRMTTDVVNVQMSFMMIIRIAIRGPLMLIFSFVMGFVMGGRLAHDLSGHHSVAGHRPGAGYPRGHADLPPGIPQVRRAQRLGSGKRPGHARCQELCPRRL